MDNGLSVVACKQMTAMTHGKASCATPGNLSQFVLIDFLKRKAESRALAG